MADTLAHVADETERGAKSLGEPYRGNLARKLKALRKERDISQQAFADSVGLSQSQLSSIERGTGSAGINTLIKMRGILAVSIDELLGLPALARTQARHTPEELRELASQVRALIATSSPEDESPPTHRDPDIEPAAALRRRPRA